LTPKQEQILEFVKRYGRVSGVTATDVGMAFDYPRKKADKWAKPALKVLVKNHLIEKNGDKYFPVKQEG
jgi:hypothetical protein